MLSPTTRNLAALIDKGFMDEKPKNKLKKFLLTILN